MDKLLYIITLSGGHFHFRTNQVEWEKLAAGAKVFFDNMVSSWVLDQRVVGNIIAEDPLIKEWFIRVPVVRCAADRRSTDHPDYFIVYSPVDKPEAHQ